MKIFAERIRSLRLANKLKQVDIASKLGIFQQSYSDYENDVSEPDLTSVCKIADIFDVSVDYLLGRADETDHLYLPIAEREHKE